MTETYPPFFPVMPRKQTSTGPAPLEALSPPRYDNLYAQALDARGVPRKSGSMPVPGSPAGAAAPTIHQIDSNRLDVTRQAFDRPDRAPPIHQIDPNRLDVTRQALDQPERAPPDNEVLTQELLDYIASNEQSHGYDSTYKNDFYGKTPLPPSQMTVAAVKAYQQHMIAEQRKAYDRLAVKPKKFLPSSPMGKFQVTQQTMNGQLPALGVSGAREKVQLFDAAFQERLARRLLTVRGYNDFLAGKIDSAEFQNRLAKEWSTVPVYGSGASYYKGQGEHARSTTERIQSILSKMKRASRP